MSRGFLLAAPLVALLAVPAAAAAGSSPGGRARVLWCSIADHRLRGMHAQLVVPPMTRNGTTAGGLR